ncbi:MAG: amidase [Chloroflexi bacterium]|nr:amidase [Chloroflexota bacterium]
MADSFIYKPIRELAELITSRQVSPVELTQTFLDRLEEFGPHYNALVTLTRERALGRARQAESQIHAGNTRGLLHGIPWGAKDLLATSGGIPTTWGAAPFKDQQFDYDATVVTRLESAGAPLAGKLAMIELAGGMGYIHPDASLTGPPKNPWDTGRWTGGSSSGSGAAVAAGLVPFAIGSETWGSILIPANNCGLAGLRPTYGRVSRHGAMALCWTLDKLGPLCLTADDCGIVLDAIAGPDGNDPSTFSEPFNYDSSAAPARRFRIGVPKGVLDEASEAVKGNFEAAVGTLADIADVEEMEFPEFPYVEITSVILMVESASAFEDFLAEGGPLELSGTGWHGRSPYARPAVLATDYIKALRLRGVMARQVDETMAKYDAIAAPTANNAATPIDEEFRSRSMTSAGAGDLMGSIGNGCGLPSISVPSGFDGDGLPTGIQFMARAYDENVCLAVAREYQARTEWHTRHPGEASPAKPDREE